MLNKHKKMIPLITCEFSLSQHVCELVFGVDVFDLDFGVLSTSFQQIDGGGLARDLCHGQQRVSPFYHISQLAYSED